MTACGLGSPTGPSPINRDYLLAPGQSVPITAAALSLKFLGVANDSRCPADALCVTGGSARVDIQVTASTGTVQIINFETGDPKAVQIGSLTIDLVQLSPYPFSAHPIDPADYRVTLRVIR